ncbi:hypothetical protein TrVE_jg12412 [Triparma verrucosa]|uniref:Uncharacterized protein n=1 Tax=Triparma verrucosa TaxID=1606542 RepID=A0A9W7C8E7_9STRA|nr:hypothetical protein TrVE_jg12412 [Triparma verrucosa]
MEKAKNLDEANEFFGETMEQIYSVLVESGLPDSSVESLKKMIEEESHMDALEATEEYTRCFPYMKTSSLIFLVTQGWEQLCTRNDYLKSKAEKKVTALVADSKTEPEVMDAAVAKREEAGRICTRGNLKLYKMRALKLVWEKKEAGDVEGGDEEDDGVEIQ